MKRQHVNRQDQNTKDIIRALKQVGCTVWNVNKEMDLVVGVPASRSIVIMEVKDGAKKKLKPSQEKFFWEWAGYPVFRVNGVDEALAVVGVNYSKVPA